MAIGRLYRKGLGVRGARGAARRLGFEKLDSRELLATLLVGPGQTFTSIQAAVNNARSGDIIDIAATPLDAPYNESINLSLMGSAVGSVPGNLTIRGAATGLPTVISSVGPTFFNTAAFTGNLRLEHLTLRPATQTAQTDAGLLLSNYNGQLVVSNIDVNDAADVGIDIANSTGTLLIDQVEIRRDETGTTATGIRLTNYTGSGFIRNTMITDLNDAGIVISNSTGQAALGILETSISSIALGTTSPTLGNDGIRVQATGSSKLDLLLYANNLEGLPGNSVDVVSHNSSQVNVQMYGLNAIVNSDSVVRIANEPAVRFSSRDTSTMRVNMEGNNVVDGIQGDALHVLANGTSTMYANISSNSFFNIGTNNTHEAIYVSSETSSSALMNVTLARNDVTMTRPDLTKLFGSGIRIDAFGNTTYNAIIDDNFISYSRLSATGTQQTGSNGAAIDVFGPGGSSSKVNLRIMQNLIDLPFESPRPIPIRLNRNTTAMSMKVEAVGFLSTYLTENNFFNAGSVSDSNVQVGDWRLPVDSMYATAPLAIGQMVFNDANKNGIHNDGEGGVFGARLDLFTPAEIQAAESQQRAPVPIMSTFSDVEGGYVLGALPAGEYVVRLTPPAGMDLTSHNRGSDEARDSDFRPGIRQANVTLVAGEDQREIDAGLIPSDGKVWKNQIASEDVNDDGVTTPLDALLVIIELNSRGSRALPTPTTSFSPTPFFDVNGDSFINPLDALLVIIKLNSTSTAGEPEPEAASLETDADGEPEDFGATEAPATYLPPEFFTGSSTSSSTMVDEDDDTDPLDAFFAEVGS